MACLLSIPGQATAHQRHHGGGTAARAPDFQFDAADATVPATRLDNPLLYDGDVVSYMGELWLAYLEFVPGKGDRIRVKRHGGAEVGVDLPAIDRYGEYAAPTLTVDGTGRLWLSYEARHADRWDVYLVRIAGGKRATAPRRVSCGDGASIHHRTAATADGLWIVWQEDRHGQFDIVARRMVDDALQGTHVVSDNPRGDWHPSIAVDRRGQVHVAWDSYVDGAFGVYLRACRDGRWGDKMAVAASPAFEGRAEIATDLDNRTWIAWEEGGENWGRPFRGINTTRIRDRTGPLHRFRMIRLAVIDRDGQPRRLADPLPMPAVEQARQRAGRPRGVERTGAFYERGKLVVDTAGRVWLVYRHFYTPWLGVTHRSHVQQGWGIYARCYTDGGWSPLYRMRIGQGDGLQRLEVCAHNNGIVALWTTGRTDRRENDRPRGLVTAALAAAGNAPRSVPLTKLDHTNHNATNHNAVAPRDAEPATITVGATAYRLFYGDLHRHTDLSLCRVPIDGTIDDAYRYAIEVARLDFLGITDHTRDLARGDALSQLWWRCRKEVVRHQLVDGEQMRFVPFYAYERSHGNTADHNVISLRGDMLRPYTYPVPEFWKELDRDTMTIPHQPIRRDTWKYQNDLLRPLVEIFQGCRDHSIEEDVHRGLAKGYHLGFIASSDHMSTGASYAAVWAERPTRASIFRSLQARRTFAATGKIYLAVRAEDHWMGEVVRAARAPRLTLRARGTAPVRAVELIVDGRRARTWSPHHAFVELDAKLDLRGQHYAYFHLVQADGNEAWSSPVWLDIVERD